MCKIWPRRARAISPVSQSPSNLVLRNDHARRIDAAMSKQLFEWPQIEFVGPSASRLTMQRPIGVGDGLDRKQTVLAFGTNIVGEVDCGVFALDGAVYDDMSDMDALRRKFAREPLRHGAQRRLGGARRR